MKTKPLFGGSGSFWIYIDALTSNIQLENLPVLNLPEINNKTFLLDTNQINDMHEKIPNNNSSQMTLSFEPAPPHSPLKSILNELKSDIAVSTIHIEYEYVNDKSEISSKRNS